MFLAVDSGNTRLKWALCDEGGRIVESGAIPAGRISVLRKIAARAEVCRAANVGGAAREEKLRAVLSACPDFAFARVEKSAGGVVNHYRPPESLGVDRWLSLLAVFALHGGSGGKGGKGGRGGRGGKGWVIVSAGTATTVDGLTAGGEFIGGLILPGLSSFPSALAKSTALSRAALSDSGGVSGVAPHPPCMTSEAAGYGALCATAGAALEYRRRFLRGAEFILTGGDANRLSGWLPKPRVIPDLVLRGLIIRQFGNFGNRRETPS